MNPPIQQPRINLSQTTGIICEECNGSLFVEAMFLRKVSRFITNTPQDVISPIPTFVCQKCGHVNDEFNPLKAQQLEDQDA